MFPKLHNLELEKKSIVLTTPNPKLHQYCSSDVLTGNGINFEIGYASEHTKISNDF